MQRLRRGGVTCGVWVAGLVCWTAVANAQPAEPARASAVVMPTLTPTGVGPCPRQLRPPATSDGALRRTAREIDALVLDTAQDLGLSIQLHTVGARDADATRGRQLAAEAVGTNQWQISPRVENDGDQLLVELVVVPAGSNVALSRVERVEPSDLAVRVVVMMRDLVRAGRGAPRTRAALADGASRAPTGLHTSASPSGRKRSEGRAVLALHAAALGGFIGYSLQKSANADDDRMTYPLVALGTGVGLGSALLVSEEWDVGTGDAWYMSAGAVWPTVGGLLIAHGREVTPSSDRYTYGIVGGLSGVSLAAIALSFRGMGEAEAAAAHSGGLLGLGLGAGTELAIRGETQTRPYQGMGYGTIAGVLIGGAVGTQFVGGASPIVMIDVGAGLGAASAAAAGSPLLLGETTESKQRAWVIGTMSGALVGGVVAWWMAWPSTGDTRATATPWWTRTGRPFAGVLGIRPDRVPDPIYGVGWTGSF